MLLGAIFASGHTHSLVQRAARKCQCRDDTAIGKIRQLVEGLLQAGPARQVAPGDLQHRAEPVAAQPGEHFRFRVGYLERRGSVGGRRPQVGPGHQLSCELGLAPATPRHELAAGPHPRQGISHFRHRQEPLRELRLSATELVPAGLHAGPQQRWKGFERQRGLRHRSPGGLGVRQQHSTRKRKAPPRRGFSCGG